MIMHIIIIIVSLVILYSCSNPAAPQLSGPSMSGLDYNAPPTELSIAGLPNGGTIGAYGKMDTCLYMNGQWVFPGVTAIEFSMGRSTGWYNMREFIYESIVSDSGVVIIDPDRYFSCWYYRTIRG